MRLQRWFLLLLLVVVAGCGGDDASSSGAAGADPAQAVPAGAPVYVEAVIRPDGEQGDNARALIERFLGEKSLTELLNQQLQETGKSYEEDIEPWLGDRLGFGVLNLAADEPTFVGALAITDAGEAEAAIADTAEKTASYEGVQLYDEDGTFVGITDDYLVFAQSEADVKLGIDAADGSSLGDGQVFKDAIGELPSERLGAFYLDTKAFGEAAAADPSLDPAARGILEQVFGDGTPVTAALTAQDDAATIESRLAAGALSALGPLATGAAPELVAQTPAGAWAVVGYSDVGQTLKTTIETFAGALGGAALTGQLESQIGINLDRDLFSWVGDLAVFVRGDSLASLEGAVVIEASDEDAARAAIPRIVGATRRFGMPLQPAKVDGADQAFSVALPGAPGPLVLAEGGGRVVIALGDDAAAEGLNPTETIEDSGLYGRAQDAIDGVAPAAIVDFTAILALAEATGATSDPDYAEAQQYLEQLDLLVAGSEKDGDAYRSLFSVKVK